MKKIQLWVMAASLIAAACTDNSSFTTPSGTKVTYLAKGTEEALVKDSIVVLYLKLTNDKDSVLQETTEDQPLALRYDPSYKAGQLQDVLTFLKVGDSVTFGVTVNDLYTETYKTMVPMDMDSAGIISIVLKVKDQMTMEGYQAYMTELQEKSNARQMVVEADSIDAYLQAQGIAATTTESGLRYVITQPGTGPNAAAGDQVTVHYHLKSFDGATIQNSQDAGQPFDFTLGVGQVIPGWDEGITYINKGGKATLYIPSPLAYGSRPRPGIPANSILVFDVEVVDINAAANEGE